MSSRLWVAAVAGLAVVVLAPGATAAPAASACAVTAVVYADITKPASRWYALEVGSMRASTPRGCSPVRTVITITDRQPAQIHYATGDGTGTAQAEQQIGYYHPDHSEPSAAPWNSSGTVTFRFEAFQGTTPVWCASHVWSVTSTGAHRVTTGPCPPNTRPQRSNEPPAAAS